MTGFRLDGRTALVTGASRGIGRAIALAFADAGADVALLARDESALGEVAAAVEGLGRRAAVAVCDVTDADAVSAAVAASTERLGPIDVLVNNAGGNSFARPFAGMRFSGWERTLRLNLDSVVHVTQAVIPQMIERRTGSVINLSSVAGLRGAPTMSHYGAAKAAVISLTQSLSTESAWAGVRVNALVPGWIETDLTGFLRDDEGTEKGLLATVPMARWGTVEEIAAPAVFLASDASSFMTGHVLVVDGGLSAMP
ncbi:MAG: glucose 1-dehydrogenase [Frankiales bacterium]|nr:glucose 1-dehydrogenase [Frankiales bacterium]